MAVLPYGKSGVIGGAMLGLGRALGETIAVAIVLSASGGITFNLISQQQPVDDRGEHRAAVPRVDRPGRQHADRQRPGAVRHHPGGQRARPLRSSTAAPTSPERTDEHRDRGRARADRAAARRGRSRSAAGCPAARRRRSSPVGVVVGVAARRADRLQRRRWPSSTAVVLGTLAVYAASRRGRGPPQGDRPAGDLRGHHAPSPSPWCRWSRWSGRCSANGLARLDAEFFNSSMRGIVGEGGGALPRDRRHADHHRAHRASSRCRSAC